MKTTYWELRKYITGKDYEFLNAFESLYNIQPLDDTEPWYTKEAQERWDNSVNHNLWSEFEKFIGSPNSTEMIEQSISATEGMPTTGIRYHMDLYWKEQFGFVERLQNYVKEWIETVDTSSVVCRKTSIVNSKDFFFNFNYTDVLEKVYGVENVLHIHGGVDSVSDIPPIMGHCNMEDIQKHRQWAKEADDEFAEAEASIQDAVANYLETIHKDTQKQMEINRRFFNNLKAVEHVIVIGWSAGDVDIPYLREIIKSVKPDSKWTVYWYNDDAYNSLKTAFEKERVDKGNIKYIQSDAFWDI